MSRKRSSQKTKRRSRRRRGGTPRILVFCQAAIILVLAGAAYIIWLDHRITTEFEGKRWSLPARVYSRPYDVILGRQMAPAELTAELRILNYQQSRSPDGPGEYARREDAVEIFLRPFRYWDGAEPGKHLRIEFSDGRVKRIRNLGEDTIESLIRLEPRLIGRIYPEHNEDRVLVPYRDVPPFLVDALIAVEDRHFFEHGGVDIRGLARALLVNLRSGEIVQGGSTLTQQLVKNFFLSPERTFWRKFNEMIMALLLEYRYSKTEILSAYINEVYLGQYGRRRVHGFGTAAEFYFGKPLNELKRHELALLAGLVRGASYYEPRRHPERALARRNLVLTLMTDQDYLHQRDAERLKSRPVELAPRQRWGQARYPAFIQSVRRELLEDYRMADLKSAGLRVFTTLDPARQDRMEAAVHRRLSELESRYGIEAGVLETAALELNISNGEILALMGGRDEDVAEFNRVLDAKRPIGSLIKPFVYLTALSKPDRYHLLTELNDSRLRITEPDGGVWQPKNYAGEEHGAVTLMEGLTQSYNLATVRLGMELGVPAVIENLNRAGLEERLKPYPSLLLGAVELSPYQVAGIYQTLANGGYKVPLKTIREVLNRHGEPLQRAELELQQSLEPGASFLIGFLLTQVVEQGTARPLRRVFPDSLRLAGKTGTTNDSRDSWFVGYDDQRLSVTWLGRDDYRPTPFTGANGAMQLWAEMMSNRPLRSLNLVASDLIEWQRDVAIPYEGECLRMDAIPYIKGYPPVDGMTCDDDPDSGPSFFNPLRWFQ